jgi:hypothetical protein
VTATFETLVGIESQLVAAGQHPLTPWWRAQLQRWYRHPTARTLVARVGRGGGKSRTAVLVSLNEVLFGSWDIPAGEVHYWAFASQNVSEASQRLMLIERCLLDLGIPCKRDGDEIRLKEMPRGWRVFACQIGAVSGFRAFGRCADELSKWRSLDRLANPAIEVVTSMTAMTITHPGARSLLISSPMGFTDYHAKRMAEGDTAHQLTCTAASWVANPTRITEQQSHEAEPDERIWRREYAAIPQAGSLSVFEPDAIARAFVQPASVPRALGRFGVVDASSGKKDSWAFAVASWCDVGGSKRLVFEKVDGFHGRFFEQKSAEAVVQEVSDCFKAHGVRDVHADQRDEYQLISAFRRHGLRYTPWAWSQPNKERAVSTVRRWLADGVLVLPEHERLKDELLEFEERTAPSGAFTFGARGSGHDDYVALLLTTAIADAEHRLPGSPSKRPGMLEALKAMGQRDIDLALQRAKGLV